ncbi:hypothetical protein L0337_39580 [candidate division KSB1 bacterium]|nr:hypothetical protein [candidate division KSB1 bacterium]
MEDGNFPTRRIEKFSEWTAAAFFLFGLAFLQNALGPLTRQTNLAVGAALIALFVVIILPRRFETRRFWHLATGLAGIIFIGLLLKPANFPAHTQAFFLVGVAVYWLGWLWRNDDVRESALLAVLFLTGFLYTVILVVHLYTPSIWHLAQAGSQLVSRSIATLFKQRQLFSATAFGLPILALFISFILSVYLLSEHRGRSKKLSSFYLLLAIFVLLVIHALWVVLQEPALKLLSRLLAHDHPRHTHLTPLHLLIVPFLLDLIPTYFFVRTCTISQISFTAPKLKKLSAIGTAGAFFLIAVILSWPDFTAPAKNRKNLFIFNRGYFNWEKPKFGQYGLTSTGMFGLLPDYLQALGYNVTIDSLLTTEKLQNAHVFVVLNLHRLLNEQEKQTIAGFVENGGALLVLGDHTGLGEMMPPLNDLLKDTSIQFNFDSAHYLKDGWPHVVNAIFSTNTPLGVCPKPGHILPRSPSRLSKPGRTGLANEHLVASTSRKQNDIGRHLSGWNFVSPHFHVTLSWH